ncbi:SDR family NAD(P)-dependent oxidoreductase [Maricurvus nonylphenolicus]|uniref:SDR family NAD(P)-dependent oxidoreductase n=1 Tax=Maricurvus nonylphenolicus TaxID=1008307 RepID=UPI0036F2A4B1
MQISGETIWITGASSGIGRALALRLAADGNRVIVTSRRGQPLQELAEQYDNIVVITADLSRPDCVDSLSLALSNATEYLDRVILNAGTCEYFEIDQPDWSMMARIMETNYLGAVHSVAASLPLLQANPNGEGHIIGVGSLASRVPFPRAEAYGASKAALDYFLGALGVDLMAKGIDVSIVQPGFVKTPLTDQNDFDMPYLLTVERAVEMMLAGICRRDLYIRFPRRLNWLIGLGHMLTTYWYRHIGPRMVRS